MVKILNSEITQRIIDTLELETPQEVPINIANTIVPVIDVQEVPRLRFASYAFTGPTNANIQVPANKRYRILGMQITYTSTATVGNRTIALAFRSTNAASSNYYRQLTTNAQAASLTRSYNFTRGVNNTTTSSYELFGLPDIWIDSNHYIGIRDEAAVDASNDTIAVNILFEEITKNSNYAN
jgi:hypothetical protein